MLYKGVFGNIVTKECWVEDLEIGALAVARLRSSTINQSCRSISAFEITGSETNGLHMRIRHRDFREHTSLRTGG